MGTTPPGKLVVIGLDGATFDIIDPLVAQGELPNLARLLETGTSGRLKSTHPPLTPPAWTTFSTGRTPAGHGIFDWTLSPFDVTSPPRFTNFNAVKAATFWEILNDRGLECGVVNLPITYPPKPMKGFLVSGMDTPNEQVTFTYPESLGDELTQNGIDHQSYFSVKDEPTTSNSPMPEQLSSDESGFQTLLEHERTIRDSILYLLRNKPWDVFVGIFMLADKVGHYFWHLRDEDGTSAKRDPVQRAYQELDSYVGRILENVPPDSHVVVVSDHGFGDSRRAFFVNAWLHQEGFLSLKPRTPGLRLRTLKVRRVSRTGHAILQKARLGFLTKLLPAGLLEREYRFPFPRMQQSVDLVDWSRTRAYAASYGVYINLEGRTEHGTVKKGAEYDALREQIRERLTQLADPDEGDRPFPKVLLKEEIYSGPYLDEAPDLVFDFDSAASDVIPSCLFRFSRVWGRRQRFGTHHFEGIFMAKGPGIKEGHRLDECRLIDMPPTLFHMLGQPVPRDFDGNVLEDIFQPGVSTSSAPEYVDVAARPLDRDEDSETYSDEDADAVARRLRDLGYIE